MLKTLVDSQATLADDLFCQNQHPFMADNVLLDIDVKPAFEVWMQDDDDEEGDEYDDKEDSDDDLEEEEFDDEELEDEEFDDDFDDLDDDDANESDFDDDDL